MPTHIETSAARIKHEQNASASTSRTKNTFVLDKAEADSSLSIWPNRHWRWMDCHSKQAEVTYTNLDLRQCRALRRIEETLMLFPSSTTDLMYDFGQASSPLLASAFSSAYCLSCLFSLQTLWGQEPSLTICMYSAYHNRALILVGTSRHYHTTINNNATLYYSPLSITINTGADTEVLIHFLFSLYSG